MVQGPKIKHAGTMLITRQKTAASKAAEATIAIESVENDLSSDEEQ